MLQFYTLLPERKGARFSVTGEVIRPNVLTLSEERSLSSISTPVDTLWTELQLVPFRLNLWPIWSTSISFIKTRERKLTQGNNTCNTDETTCTSKEPVRQATHFNDV